MCTIIIKIGIIIPIHFKFFIYRLGLQTDAEEHLFIADNKGQRVWRRDSGTTDLITVMSQQVRLVNVPTMTQDFSEQ